MVNQEFKREMVNTLGKGLSKKFTSYLEDKEILSTKNEYYSESGIRTYIYVINTPHPLDDIFLQFIEEELKILKSQKQKTKKIMQQINI